MTKKASFAAEMAAGFFKKPTLLAGGSVALSGWLLLSLSMLTPMVARAQAADCTIQGCNVLCHNDFENFALGGDVYYVQAGVPAPVRYLSNSNGQNTVDVLRQTENGNHFVSFRYSLNNDNVIEMVIIKMRPGRAIFNGYNASLRFKAVALPAGSVPEGAYDGAVSLAIYGLHDIGSCAVFDMPDCTSSSFPLCNGTTAYCMTGQAAGSNNFGIPIDVDETFVATNFNVDFEGVDFQQYGPFDWQNNTGTSINYIMLVARYNQPPTVVETTLFNIDNIEINSDFYSSYTIEPTILKQCADGQVQIEYKTCAESYFTGPWAIDFRPVIPSGMTLVPGGGFNQNGVAQTLIYTQPGEPTCTTQTLTLNVNPNTFVQGQEVTVGLEILSSNICQNLFPGDGSVKLTMDYCEPCACPAGTGNYNLGADPSSVTYASALINPPAQSGTVENACIAINGKLIVDLKNLEIRNSHITLNKGAEIEVPSGSHALRLFENTIEGCHNMWRSITVGKNAQLVMEDNNLVADAQWAVRAEGGSSINLINNTFDKNFVDIYVPPPSSINGLGSQKVTSVITGNKFKCSGDLMFPYPKQLPAPGKYSFAVAYLNNVTGVNLGAGNEATGHRNGMVAQRSTFSISASSVTNMTNLSTAASEPSPFHLNQRGVWANSCPLTTVQDNTFSGFVQGIEARNSGIDARRNVMTGQSLSTLPTEAHFGIRTANVNAKIVTITRNTLTVPQVGIEVSNCPATTGLRVSKNKISVTGEQGFEAIRLENAANGWVRENEVTNKIATNPFTGLSMINCRSFNVLQNKFYNMGTGVQTSGCSGNYFMGNQVVLDPLDPDASSCLFGFDVQMSTARYCGNVTNQQQQDGFRFLGMGTPSFLECSEIGSAATGLRVLDGASIGQQKYTGNRWTGTYSEGGFGAIHESDDEFLILFSKFLTEDASFLRPSWKTGNNMTLWFDDDEPGSSTACASLGGLGCPVPVDLNDPDKDPDPPLPPGKGSDDDRTALGDHNTDWFNWMAQQNLYDRLYQAPSMMDSEPVLQGFYNAAADTTLGELHDVQQGVIAMLRRDSLTRSQVGALQTQAAFWSDSLAVLQNAGAGADSLQVQNATQWLANATGALAQWDSAFWVQRRAEGLGIQQTNALIATSNNVFAANEKTLNQLYLQHRLWEDARPSAYVLSLIKAIADQCPQDGGFSVYQARGLYRLHEPLAVWDDANCSGLGARPLSTATVTANTHLFLLAPNPATDVVLIQSRASSHQELNLMLFDATGRRVALLPLPVGQTTSQINVASLPTGLYHYQIVEQGQVLQAGKLAISR